MRWSLFLLCSAAAVTTSLSGTTLPSLPGREASLGSGTCTHTHTHHSAHTKVAFCSQMQYCVRPTQFSSSLVNTHSRIPDYHLTRLYIKVNEKHNEFDKYIPRLCLPSMDVLLGGGGGRGGRETNIRMTRGWAERAWSRWAKYSLSHAAQEWLSVRK